ncbi:MAG: hydroxymethylpyrimidine/phosphomethylpyrimidine kinase [Chromatiales bacterium]|jgi:hydroxymethylpyrimidine/phosphomethylpyrimidine kinase|nr:hydroxymethylpyrimidine/phosphomethylpyrimidine kinase [Chromatiales bacterium]MDX9766744.1 hydroxymethylpyrimidine/phosphomethylpyrimidine kinase [Ectothiorhodospiraceae bacterium]
MTDNPTVPVVMTFAGSDPTGGAGLQADIEAIISMGCHAATVVTCVTVQDTAEVIGLAPLDAELVMQQARAVLEDMPVAAFKIGLLGSIEIVQAVHTVLMDYPDIPVVFDPVLASGSGSALADEEIVEGMVSLLLPLTTVLTPNSLEARALAPGSDTLDASAMALLDQGVELVLITGTHENTPQVHNVLYGNHRRLEAFAWDRLEGSFHGSGCTLASAIAGLLGQGNEPFSAIHEAQEYTWQALKHGYRPGMGQRLPNRLFWATLEEDGEADAE